MQRRLCEMSEAKWSITEAKCLQISHNKYASQRDAISPSMGNLMLSHSAGMHNTDKSIAGISKRFHFASLHYIFSAYLPTHIKFLTEFHCIFFGTTCISISKIKRRDSFGNLSFFLMELSDYRIIGLSNYRDFELLIRVSLCMLFCLASRCRCLRRMRSSVRLCC